MTHRAIRAGTAGVILIIGLIGIGVPIPAVAGELAADYEAVISERRGLERRRADYESAVAKLARRQRAISTELLKCIGKHYEPGVWEPRLDDLERGADRLETLRETLARLRVDLNRVRDRMEARRRTIEETHRRKGPGSAYESEFRRYMADLRTDYLDRIESELFAGYEDYVSGVREYIGTLTTMMDNCESRRTPSLE